MSRSFRALLDRMALYVLDELHDELFGVAGDPHTIPERTGSQEQRRT
jgi:hypothetical protein